MIKEIQFVSGLTYKGEVKNGKPEGIGELAFDGGRVRYSGHWHDGKFEGNGRLFAFNGDLLFEGEFKNGKYYTGEGKQAFSGGQRHVKGKEKWHHHNTIRREGQWANGRFTGTQHRRAGDRKNALCEQTSVSKVEVDQDKAQGEFSFAGMTGIYNGDWVKGVGAHGSGTFRDFNGLLIYKGEWKHGQFCGYGHLVYKNGDVYRGQMKNNQPWGFGSRFDRNGLPLYDGLWKAGRVHFD